MVVLDMFSVLLHGTLVPDPVEGKDDRRTYSGLVRKLKVKNILLKYFEIGVFPSLPSLSVLCRLQG